MSGVNYHKFTYEKKDGSKGEKELTSTTKKASQLGTEAKTWCRQHGYKYHSGSSGTRH